MLLSSTIHYILLTQDIDNAYTVMEFFLYSDFAVTAYYFVTQISTGALKDNKLIKITKIALIGIFIFLCGILIYFVALMGMNDNLYRDCENPGWISCRAAAFILGIIYFGIGLKASIELTTLKKNKSLILLEQGEHDLW